VRLTLGSSAISMRKFKMARRSTSTFQQHRFPGNGGSRLTVPGSLYQYAVGRIVLWTGHESRIDVTKGLRRCATDRQKNCHRQSKHAPYAGRLWLDGYFKGLCQVKDKLNWERISRKRPVIESERATSGSSRCLGDSSCHEIKGDVWEVPAEAHPSLDQGAVILKQSKNQEAARQFLEFIKGPTDRRS